jgi:hypothetical protein
MPLVAFTIKLSRIDESLLYQDKGGGWWLSAVCSLDTDAKGRTIVAQSIPRERYAAGEKGPALGTWREIGSSKPSTEAAKGTFDLAKYMQQPRDKSGGQSSFTSPTEAYDAARQQRNPGL